MIPSGNIAFENGQPVLVVEPEAYRETEKELSAAQIEEIRSETMRLLFAVLLADGADALETGARAHILAWECGCHPANPQSQSEVAKSAGVSQSSVSRIKEKCSNLNVSSGSNAPRGKL